MRTIDNTMGDRSSAGVSGPVTRGSIIARLERLPGNAMQVRARILIGLATFFDGFDVIAIAATLPILIQKWGLTPWEIGFLIASGSIGQLLGAFVFPWYAERKGRVRAIALSSGIIGVTSIACGFAPTFVAFVVLRIIQGLGLGGELPVAATYINEISRAHGRGRFVLLYEIVFPVGLLASNALGAWIVPRVGWQAMYFIGGLPLILFFVLRRLVPESPRWLAERERMADADAAVLAFERATKGPLAPVEHAVEFDAMAESASEAPDRRSVWASLSEAHAGGGDVVGDVRIHSVRSFHLVAHDLSHGLSRAVATGAEPGGGGFCTRGDWVADLRIARRQGGAQTDHQCVVRVVCDFVGAGWCVPRFVGVCGGGVLRVCAWLPGVRVYHGLCLYAGVVSHKHPRVWLWRWRCLAEGGGDLRAGDRLEDHGGRPSRHRFLYSCGRAIPRRADGALSWD
jgi:hypothetical protein